MDPQSRRDAAQRRADLAETGRRAEATQAQRLIDDFVAEAGRRGLAPQPLRAQTYAGASVKTDKTGWYLTNARSVAIGADGSYYVLLVPGSLTARLTGVRLEGQPPPLHVGQGGRDGEGGELSWFLQRVLNGAGPA